MNRRPVFRGASLIAAVLIAVQLCAAQEPAEKEDREREREWQAAGGDDARAVEAAGDIDVLIARLALPAPSTALEAVRGEEWRSVFAHRVDPLPRLARAVWPQFTARGTGRIVVIGSAAG